VAEIGGLQDKGEGGRMDRVVFVGNDQASSLAFAYKLAAGDGGRGVQFIQASAAPPGGGWDRIRDAELVFVEVTHPGSADWVNDLAPRGVIHLFPIVLGDFLWPLAGEPHVENYAFESWPDGPYPAELGDAYLNRMLTKGVTPEEAVQRYVAEDLNRIVDLDGLYRNVIERQRSIDSVTGFNVADLIESRFREEPLFLTRRRPGRKMVYHILRELRHRAGSGSADVTQFVHDATSPRFPLVEMPIHPSVSKHFGLRYGGPDWEYRYSGDKTTTFSQFALKYMRFEIDGTRKDLDDGIRLSREGNSDAALPKLSRGLAAWPASAEGHYALAIAYERQQRPDLALTALRRAIELDPWESQYYGKLSVLLSQTGRWEDSIAAARRAITLDPTVSHYHAFLAGILTHFSQLLIDDAEREVRTAIELESEFPHFYLALIKILEHQGRLTEALEVALRGVDSNPAAEDLRSQLERLHANVMLGTPISTN
jgi:tetratricopeptide (TPR) repeat protein